MRHAASTLPVLLALLLPFVLGAGDAQALLLYAKGGAGSFAAAEREAGPSAAGPVTLTTMPVSAGGRNADFTAVVDAGAIRLTALATADIGAQSVGDWRASVEGSWEDTITFDASPGLPGVDIIPGVTAGSATLVVEVSGILSLIATNSLSRARYGASLGYGTLAPFADRPTGPTWTDFRGSAQKAGENDIDFGFDGDPLPTLVELPVEFIFGESFDVLFKLSTTAEIGWEGTTTNPLEAAALLGQSALWQGPQNVVALVSNGMGGTMEVPLTSGDFGLTSPTTDYTDAVVPEPGPPALACLALAVVAIRRHRTS